MLTGLKRCRVPFLEMMAREHKLGCIQQISLRAGFRVGRVGLGVATRYKSDIQTQAYGEKPIPGWTTKNKNRMTHLNGLVVATSAH